MLSNVDTIHISAVLEDCVDQLAILGHIMPPSLQGKQEAAQIVDDELGQILQDQRDLESRYEVVRIEKRNKERFCVILSYGWDTEAYSEPPVRSVKPQIYQFYNFYLIKKGKGSAT